MKLLSRRALASLAALLGSVTAPKAEAPERRVWYIDTGSMSPEEVAIRINAIRDAIRQRAAAAGARSVA